MPFGKSIGGELVVGSIIGEVVEKALFYPRRFGVAVDVTQSAEADGRLWGNCCCEVRFSQK